MNNILSLFLQGDCDSRAILIINYYEKKKKSEKITKKILKTFRDELSTS